MFLTALFIIAKEFVAARLIFNKWKDKLWYIQRMEYYSAVKRKELSNHKKTWNSPKCVLLRERNKL